jgi:ATP-dependent helicase/DNAse subunit B
LTLMKRIIVREIPDLLAISGYELVLTPTRAIARSLKTPHHTLESVAETIVKKKGLKIASVLLTRRLLQNAVKEILSVKDVAGITALWTPVIQEFLRSGHDLFALEEHPNIRVSNLARVAIFYREQLRSKHYIDRSELFWQATKYCGGKKSCLFYGYFTPNTEQVAFINTLSGDRSLFVLPCEESAIFTENQDRIDWLKSQDWQTIQSSRSSDQSTRRSAAILHCYPNQEAEVRGVLTQIKLLLAQNVHPSQIVIVAKDEQLYGDTLLDVAWEYNVPIRAFYAVSFLTTRLGIWLKLLLEIIVAVNYSEQLPFETVIKFLSHPLAKQLDGETWQQARINYPQTIESWQAIKIDLTVLQLPKKTQSDRWLELFQSILETFTVSQKVKSWAKEILAYYQFQEALQELLLTTERIIIREEIIKEIQELIANLNIPIQVGRGGVELHSPLSLFGSQYQYVFVLGMAENIFPVAVSDDLVLGYSDRKQLEQESIKINTITRIMQKEALSFHFLLQISTKKIIFSYPQIIERQACYPSRYLASLNLQPTEKKHNYLASIEEARQLDLIRGDRQQNNLERFDSLLNYIYQKWQIEQERRKQTASEYNGLIKISLNYQKLTFSASQLTQIGQCPFKWFAARLLRLKEIAETKLVLENNLKGSIYHQCLEMCLAEIESAADLEKLSLQQLQQALQTAETNLQITNIPSWSKQKQELLNLLSINLNNPDFLTSDSTIIEREKEFTTQWHGLTVTGKIDRLDRTSTGIKVIDYKTSSSLPLGIKDESELANLDLQIPLYIDAMTREYPETNIDAVYYSLSKCQPLRRTKTNPENLAKFAQQVKQYLTEGNYPIAPDLQFKACHYCQFDLVCRKRV